MLTDKSSDAISQESWFESAQKCDPLRLDLEHRRGEPTQYSPPKKGTKWKAGLSVLYTTDLNKAEATVLHCFIDHANQFHGRCDPGVSRVAWITALPKRTVERAINGLKRKKYLLRQRRGTETSAATHINWNKLKSVFDAWKARERSWTGERNRLQTEKLNRQDCRIGTVKGGG